MSLDLASSLQSQHGGLTSFFWIHYKPYSCEAVFPFSVDHSIVNLWLRITDIWYKSSILIPWFVPVLIHNICLNNGLCKTSTTTFSWNDVQNQWVTHLLQEWWRNLIKNFSFMSNISHLVDLFCCKTNRISEKYIKNYRRNLPGHSLLNNH